MNIEYISEDEKRRVYNHNYYLKNKERILAKNRKWSKAQRATETEEERYALMVETNRKKYGKDYYRKIGRISAAKMKGVQSGFKKYVEQKRAEKPFESRLDRILKENERFL